MVVHSHQHGCLQVSKSEGEVLVPLRVQVALDDCTAILEGGALEFDIGITGA